MIDNNETLCPPSFLRADLHPHCTGMVPHGDPGNVPELGKAQGKHSAPPQAKCEVGCLLVRSQLLGIAAAEEPGHSCHVPYLPTRPSRIKLMRAW